VSSPAWLIILVGIGVGTCVGMVGTGGAFIIPTLIFGFGLTQLRAQGTALLIASLPIWIVPLIPYVRAKQVDWRLGLVLAIGLTVGSWFGAQWAQQLPVGLVRKTFAVVLVSLAIKLFLQR